MVVGKRQQNQDTRFLIMISWPNSCDLKTEGQLEGARQTNIIVVEMEQAGQQQNSG